MNYIYVVSTFEKCETCENGWLKFGDIRSVCWKEDYDSAKNIVDNNVCDIFEFMYSYAVIEKLPECLYPASEPDYERHFFKWNSQEQKYIETNEIEDIISGTHVIPTFSIG